MSRRLVVTLAVAVAVVSLAWVAWDITGDTLGGGHGQQVHDLGAAMEALAETGTETFRDDPGRRAVVAILHLHLNAVVWGDTPFDGAEFHRVAGVLDEGGASEELVDRIHRARRLAARGRAFAAHDLLAEVQADLATAR